MVVSPSSRCGCAGAACSCVIQSSDTVAVSGSGTPTSPFVLTTVGVGALTCLERKAIYNALIALGMAVTPATNLSGYDGSC